MAAMFSLPLCPSAPCLVFLGKPGTDTETETGTGEHNIWCI